MNCWIFGFRNSLLRNRGLVSYGAPGSVLFDPDSCVAIGAAEVLAEVAAFYFCFRGYNSSFSVDSHYDFAYINKFIMQLGAAAYVYHVALGHNRA